MVPAFCLFHHVTTQLSFCMERALWEVRPCFCLGKDDLCLNFVIFCYFSQRSLRWTADGLQYAEPQAERARRFDSYIDLGFAISSVMPKGLWVGLAIWGLFLCLTNTHTHLYLITVTLNPACSAFELSIPSDIISLTSLPPLKERLIRSNCSGPIRSGHLFLHLRTGFTWTWCNQHYVTVGLHNIWDIYIFSIIWWIQYNMLIWCSNKKKYH